MTTKMKRYLLKLEGRDISFIEIPKGASLQKTFGGVRVVSGNRVGVPLKGYTYIEAKNSKDATEKFLGVKVKIHKTKRRR